MENVKLTKGSKVKLAGKEYEVTVVGSNQVTLKNVKDGKTRRVAFSSSAYAKIEVLELVESKETEAKEEKTSKKAPKKREGKKLQEKEDIKPLNIEEFEMESWKELVGEVETVEEAPHFKFEAETFTSAWIYSIQRANKAQRLEYILKKLEMEGEDSFFGLLLAIYKVRQNYKFNFNKFEQRVLQDKVHQGKRAKKIKIADILEAMKPALHKSQNKITMEMYDAVIKTIPDDGVDGKQSWIFYAIDGLWTDVGSLKLSQQDLANIKIPMS